MASKTYCEYFKVDDAYFPCIDESAINAGAPWKTTYPHETFIELLNSVEKMLGGSTKRSIWIHGAYGTGKSQCTYALKKILEVSNEELLEYWNNFPILKNNQVLLEKLKGHKEQGILTAYRYASGSINSPQLLFLAVQESIRSALDSIPNSYKGENSLKESVICWLNDPTHQTFVNSLLQKPEWMSEFPQSNADEIIDSLRRSSDVTGLMESIFKMASKEGITALSLTADSLCAWIKDVIDKNHTKIVLIWDEFSDYFRINRNSLGDFQKIVSLCQETHFYFVIVTHPIISITGASPSKDSPMSVVMQRYKQIEITLPPNIAFELIGHAISVIPAAKDSWLSMTNDLNSRLGSSRLAVMKSSGVKNESIMQMMLPIHPMAALVLKNIASAFQSNQRSMFDFIKTASKDSDVQAFQWFIQNTSPESDRPLLTVDMLWDFFYEKGKDYLTSDIKLILDTYHQQTNLTEKEKIILQAILIMQAVDQRLGGAITALKATDQNLSYVFEGDWDEYENECKSIAKALVKKGILIQTPLADGKQVYSAAVLAGDSVKIDKYKEDLRKNASITRLVEEGGEQLASALNLTPALRLRYASDTREVQIVTVSNFVKTLAQLRTKDSGWHFYAVLALAKTDDEAQNFRSLIKKTIINEEYKDILVIDALSSPLGVSLFEEYIDYSAMSMYYNHNNTQQCKENSRKAKEILALKWKKKIHDGEFFIWSYANQEGEKANGAHEVHTIMQTVVLSKFDKIFDFTRGVTEGQLKLSHAKQSAKYGFAITDVKGLMTGCEKFVLGRVWNRDSYWTEHEFENDAISVIKRSLNALIDDAFSNNGRISISDICEHLENDFGFAPCNLTAFILGFLLKEYKGEPYRCIDAEGYPDSMTPDKLSEMIGNYYSKKSKGMTYIVVLTEEEKSFYKLSSKAWNIDTRACSSPSQVSSLIQARMRELGYPVWTLEGMDEAGVYDIVKKYIALVQSEGKATHNIAIEIGKIGMQCPQCGEKLQALLTIDNCMNGMTSFIHTFEGGILSKLADEIGASVHVLSDIKKLFSVKHAAQWLSSTGEDEIRNLIDEYSFVKETNDLLNVSTDSKDGAFKAWREQLKFLGISSEAIQEKYPSLSIIFTLLLKIFNYNEIIPNNVKELFNELESNKTLMHTLLNSSLNSFIDIYNPYLVDFSTEECEAIRNSITEDIFTLSLTGSNAVVKKAADEYRKGQIREQLFKKWKDKTNGTKSPRQWSEKYRTPILCCIPTENYGSAKRVFEVLNKNQGSEAEIKMALDFIEETDLFDKISDSSYRDECFISQLVGFYSKLLPNIAEIREALEDTGISAYDWVDDPKIKEKIKNMATDRYTVNGSELAITTIDSMPDGQLRKWLKQLVERDMELGVKIIESRGDI